MRKRLVHREYESPVAWATEENPTRVKSYFDFEIVFSMHNGLGFVASAPNISVGDRNPFKAIFRLLEHESIGMQKYDSLKCHVRKLGLWKHL